eukprot:13635-Heterococcus_DN1.PRE.3
MRSLTIALASACVCSAVLSRAYVSAVALQQCNCTNFAGATRLCGKTACRDSKHHMKCDMCNGATLVLGLLSAATYALYSTSICYLDCIATNCSVQQLTCAKAAAPAPLVPLGCTSSSAMISGGSAAGGRQLLCGDCITALKHSYCKACRSACTHTVQALISHDNSGFAHATPITYRKKATQGRMVVQSYVSTCITAAVRGGEPSDVNFNIEVHTALQSRGGSSGAASLRNSSRCCALCTSCSCSSSTHQTTYFSINDKPAILVLQLVNNRCVCCRLAPRKHQVPCINHAYVTGSTSQKHGNSYQY